MRPTFFSKSLLPLFHARCVISGQIHDPFIAGNILESLLRADPSAHSTARLFLSFSPRRSAFMYNSLLHAYLCHNLPHQALSLFHEMLNCDITPNNHTLPLILKALAQTGQLKNGASLHSMIIKCGFGLDEYVHASLIFFYGSLERVFDARCAFDDSWVPGVSAWTALLSTYAKVGNLSSARAVFGVIPQRNLVSWSAMISAYVHFGEPREALGLFHEMMIMNLQPTYSILASILIAAAELGALQAGKSVHGFLQKRWSHLSSNLKTSLVHMYAKCGDLLRAKQIFDRLSERNVDLWNAMIAGLGLHGKGEEAFELFTKMVDKAIQPDDMTFICLLSAYSHSGMITEGLKCFKSMLEVYDIEPKVEHYSCMVDLFGKAGFLMQAIHTIKIMPMKPNSRIWGSLFGACKVYGEIRIGEAVGKYLIETEPCDPGCYVLLASLYASTGRWNNALTVREVMKSRGLELEPGCSLIELDDTHFTTNEHDI